MVKPKKSLGQHFLIQPSIAQKIVHLIPSSPQHLIIEIGPGKGILTQFLIQLPNSILAIDIDPESTDYLKKFFHSDNLTILTQDILTYSFPQNKIFLIGNLPYNISSPIFFQILDNHEKIDFAVVMIQKEVAERITAKPGSKSYGILSVLTNLYYETKIEFHVKPGAFFPPPKVDSSVLTLKKKTQLLTFNKDTLFKVVKIAFQQRRKMLHNSLKNIIPHLPENLKNLRPEQLSLEDFVQISGLISDEN
jgi:16S rRNA (adenine1518-N6/adenine1519-N6)-dimethyltransferase